MGITNVKKNLWLGSIYTYLYIYIYISLSLSLSSPSLLSLSPSLRSFQEYQSVVDAEWNILYDKLEKIVESGAKVVLSKLPIGDVATQYFADR